MTGKGTVREAVAAFDGTEKLEAAIDELLTHGFGRMDLSLLAGDEAIKTKLGHGFSSTRELEDDPEVPTLAYVAREDVGNAEGVAVGGLLYVGALAGMIPVLASGGAIGAAIVAAAIGGGAGSGIGALLARFIDRHHAERLERQIAEGGILLWVRTRDAGHEEKAKSILERHGGQDVHVHGVPEHTETLTPHYGAKADLPEVGRLAYGGHDVLVMADGHCYVAGRLFPSEAEARRHLDELAKEL